MAKDVPVLNTSIGAESESLQVVAQRKPGRGARLCFAGAVNA
jgi:hypothetical protein